MNDKRIKMVLLSILGAVIPFGSIWLPFTVRVNSKELINFRLAFMTVAIVCAVFFGAMTIDSVRDAVFGSSTSFPWELIGSVIGAVLPAIIFLPWCIYRREQEKAVTD